MSWKPYTDLKNKAFFGVIKALFPNQTKTTPRIVAWSIVFAVDLIIAAVCAVHFGLLQSVNPGGKYQTRFIALLLIAAIIAVFRLQGFIWYGIAGLFKKEDTEP